MSEEPKEEQKEVALYPVDTIAKLFGISARQVNELTYSGVIATIKPKKGRRGYELIPTVQKYTAYLRNKAQGKAATEEEEKLKRDKLKAEINLKESQLELHQLKTAIANGKYLKIEDVKTDYQRFFNQFKKFAQAMPARLITQVSGYIDPAECRALEKQMNVEVTSMLRAFIVAAQAGDDK